MCFGLAAAGCAGWPIKPETPYIALTDVRLAKLSLTHPELELRLLLENPNGFALEVKGLDFVVAFAGRDFANGHADEGFVIPERGTIPVKILVVAKTKEVLERLGELVDPEPDLSYVMRGRIQLARWPLPIPFQVRGHLLPDDRGG